MITAAEWAIVGLSLKVAFWATLLSLPLGLWVALDGSEEIGGTEALHQRQVARD